MLHRYPVLFSIALLATGASAQTPLTPSQYDALKRTHQLPADAVIVGQHAPQGHWTPTGHERGGGNPCECWVQPDSTYLLAMEPNDDMSSAPIALPFTFDLFGQQYTSLYINNNGNVSFVDPYATYTASGFPIADFVMVAPFWADVMTLGYDDNGNPFTIGSVVYKITPTALYVNWDAVGYFNGHSDKVNSFQLIITDGTDPAVPGGNVSFCYGDMQWTTGDASMGVNGLGGAPAVVGANQGDATNYSQIGLFDTTGTSYAGPVDTSGVDWLDNRHLIFSTQGVSVPPVFGTTDDCDTLTIPESGGLMIAVDAYPGNFGDNVTMVSSCSTLDGYSEQSNIGGEYAEIIGLVETHPGDAGLHDILFTATTGRDDLVSVLHRYVNVQAPTGINELNRTTLSIAPNPATDQVTVAWPANHPPLRIYVMTLDGKVARSVSPTVSASTARVDLTGLAPGAYVVRAQGTDGVVTARLVKTAR